MELIIFLFLMLLIILTALVRIIQWHILDIKSQMTFLINLLAFTLYSLALLIAIDFTENKNLSDNAWYPRTSHSDMIFYWILTFFIHLMVYWGLAGIGIRKYREKNPPIQKVKSDFDDDHGYDIDYYNPNNYHD